MCCSTAGYARSALHCTAPRYICDMIVRMRLPLHRPSLPPSTSFLVQGLHTPHACMHTFGTLAVGHASRRPRWLPTTGEPVRIRLGLHSFCSCAACTCNAMQAVPLSRMRLYLPAGTQAHAALAYVQRHGHCVLHAGSPTGHLLSHSWCVARPWLPCTAGRHVCRRVPERLNAWLLVMLLVAALLCTHDRHGLRPCQTHADPS